MKSRSIFFHMLILSTMTLSFLSCSKDNLETEIETDKSLLVGTWDSRLLYTYYKYEGGEWTDNNEYPGYQSLSFDKGYYGMWGPFIQTNGTIKIGYSYDPEKQIILLSDGTKMNVLKLTESELEIESCFENEDEYCLQRETYERRAE